MHLFIFLKCRYCINSYLLLSLQLSDLYQALYTFFQSVSTTKYTIMDSNRPILPQRLRELWALIVILVLIQRASFC
jgi:hypothetical protein